MCEHIFKNQLLHARALKRKRFFFLFVKSITDELRHVRESESRLKQQYAEAQRREKLLVRRLAAKEQEMQDYAVRLCRR